MGTEHVEDKSFDLGLGPEISIVLLDAYENLYGHLSAGTKMQVWRCIRKFSAFLRDAGLAQQRQLPADVMSGLYDWINVSPLAGSTRQSIFNVCRAILLWCYRNHERIFSASIKVDSRNFIRQAPRSTVALDRDVAERIIDVCFREADDVVARVEEGWLSLKNSEADIWILMRDLLRVGRGDFPSECTIGRSGECLARRVGAAGGLRYLWGLLYPRPADLISFYVAITLQVAGNPGAIANLRRSCIVKNPLRPDREWIVWDKPRSGCEQRVDFPAAKHRSAPSMVRRLLSITEPLASKSKKLGDLLFLCYERGRITSPSTQTWHNELAKFISRHQLPNFDFVQLRKTSAVLHHRAGASILEAKHRLNHASVATTHRYTSLEDRAEQHDRLIEDGQAALFTRVRRAGKPTVLESPCETAPPAAPADTIFGFVCKDPYAGYGDVEGGSGPCDHFFRCATCPGALVPLDRIDIVRRLIDAQAALNVAKRQSLIEGWAARFEALYAPTLLVIEKDLLPKVSAELMREALALKTNCIPPLE